MIEKNKYFFIISGKDPLKNAGGYASYAYNLAKILANDINKEYLHLICISDSGKEYTVETDFCYIHNVKVPFKDIKTPLLPIHSYYISKHIVSFLSAIKIDYETIVLALGPWGLVGKFLKSRTKNPIKLVSIYFTTFKHEGKMLLEGISIKDYGIVKKAKYFIIYYLLISILNIFEKMVIKNSDYILVHYNSTANIIKNQFNVDDKIIYSPYYSVELFSKNKKNRLTLQNIPTKPLIITICRQESRKGINYLLHAIEKLKHLDNDECNKVNFLIIGSGDMLKSNEQLAKKLAIDDLVRFLGFVDDVEPFLRYADIFIHPALEEGSSAISIQEAMKYGIPIITTKCDGMPEDIIDGYSGILVTPANSDELLNATIKLLTNESLRVKLGINAKKVYLNKFTEIKMELTVKEILKLL